MSLAKWVNEHYSEKGPAKWLVFLLEAVAASVLFLLMLTTCLDVAGRYLFASPVPGATELTRLGLALMVFAAMPVITYRGGHIVVDLLDNVLGETVLKALGVVSALIISSSMYFLGVRIFEIGERSIRGGVVTEFLGLPSGYIAEYTAIMSWLTAACMITLGVYRILFTPNK
ncbi:TRAP transporter small permease [Marinobacter subterrani]|uniref:TRAP transporter small permease n=1 Tax=Marinobacter subterrani TaxID=1658765 RepID=UPI002357260E|nr:TRAP transporter small permease [Marinobacter subterrani]